jgi:hypothetical protein
MNLIKKIIVLSSIGLCGFAQAQATTHNIKFQNQSISILQELGLYSSSDEERHILHANLVPKQTLDLSFETFGLSTTGYYVQYAVGPATKREIKDVYNIINDLPLHLEFAAYPKELTCTITNGQDRPSKIYGECH